MRSWTCIVFSAAFAAAALAQSADERPFLSPMFTDHMVLQRNIPIPVWGSTTPGSEVTVSLDGTTSRCIAQPDGCWAVRLPRQTAGGPYTMTVSGQKSVTLTDVLVGDVWICSGQSNMEMGITTTLNAEAEINAANDDKIRLFTVPHRVEPAPVQWAQGEWLKCTPANLRLPATYWWVSFSGAAYYFAREIRREVDVPIGLIQTTWGGTPVETWMSAKALRAYPEYKDSLEALDTLAQDSRNGKSFSFPKDIADWWARNDPGCLDASPWSSQSVDTSSWKKVPVPSRFEDVGLESFDGIVWYRGSFEVAASDAGKVATLYLGLIDDRERTWVNGIPVGYTGLCDRLRQYRIPAGTLRSGVNSIAVSVLDGGLIGGFTSTPETLHLQITGGADIPLAGQWFMKQAAPLSALAPAPPDLTGNANSPTVLFNGMVAPVIPYGICGAIWYQGESNAAEAYKYQALLSDMIKDWRQRWGVGDFPFYMVQLANFWEAKASPEDSDWAELREAQSKTAQSVRNAGIAVAIDIGDAKDIHPKNKQEVGRRLALVALNKVYGRKVAYSGPLYRSMKVEGAGIRLKLNPMGGGLVAKGGPLKGFAIAGADRKFVWAEAKIDGSTIVVSSPLVRDPVAVRYAWAQNPDCNLYNEAGLPASPFRTDKWPGVTEPKK